jgi:hypothetical protein
MVDIFLHFLNAMPRYTYFGIDGLSFSWIYSLVTDINFEFKTSTDISSNT